MFQSLKYSYSVQEQGRRWVPVEDKKSLLTILKRYGQEDTVYRVCGLDYLSNPEMITHKFCERMIWGNECFGRGFNGKN